MGLTATTALNSGPINEVNRMRRCSVCEVTSDDLAWSVFGGCWVCQYRGERQLANGDEIRIGETVLLFREETSGQSDQASPTANQGADEVRCSGRSSGMGSLGRGKATY